MATIMAQTLCGSTQPHPAQGHHSIPATLPDAVFHNEDKRATSLRICPCLYYECLSNTFGDPLVFRKVDATPTEIIASTIAEINTKFRSKCPWALRAGRDLPNAYVLPKRKITVSLWQTNFSLLLSSFLSYVELRCQADLPTTTKGFPT